jgi:hypothetical protein
VNARAMLRLLIVRTASSPWVADELRTIPRSDREIFAACDRRQLPRDANYVLLDIPIGTRSARLNNR